MSILYFNRKPDCMHFHQLEVLCQDLLFGQRLYCHGLQKPSASPPRDCIPGVSPAVQALSLSVLVLPLASCSLLERKWGGKKWGTKVLSLINTVSVPECACPARNTGIVSAFGLSMKYWNTSSTKTNTMVGGGCGWTCWVVDWQLCPVHVCSKALDRKSVV